MEELQAKDVEGEETVSIGSSAAVKKTSGSLDRMTTGPAIESDLAVRKPDLATPHFDEIVWKIQETCIKPFKSLTARTLFIMRNFIVIISTKQLMVKKRNEYPVDIV
jgi:hypothetical protein